MCTTSFPIRTRCSRTFPITGGNTSATPSSRGHQRLRIPAGRQRPSDQAANFRTGARRHLTCQSSNGMSSMLKGCHSLCFAAPTPSTACTILTPPLPWHARSTIGRLQSGWTRTNGCARPSSCQPSCPLRPPVRLTGSATTRASFRSECPYGRRFHMEVGSMHHYGKRFPENGSWVQSTLVARRAHRPRLQDGRRTTWRSMQEWRRYSRRRLSAW